MVRNPACAPAAVPGKDRLGKGRASLEGHTTPTPSSSFPSPPKGLHPPLTRPACLQLTLGGSPERKEGA